MTNRAIWCNKVGDGRLSTGPNWLAGAAPEMDSGTNAEFFVAGDVSMNLGGDWTFGNLAVTGGGSAALANGSFAVTGALSIDDDTAFGLSSAATSSVPVLTLGKSAGSTGTVSIADDAVLTITGASRQILNFGSVSGASAVISQSGGTVRTSGGGSVGIYMHLGYNSGAMATYDMTGGKFEMLPVKNGGFVVGDSGTGILNVSNATFETRALNMGGSSGGSGTVNLRTGGTIIVHGRRDSDQWILRGNNGGTATFNFDGGTLQVGSGCTIAKNTTGYINTGVATTVSSNGGTIDTQGYPFTVNPEVSGDGVLTLAGTGTVTFASAPTCALRLTDGATASLSSWPTAGVTFNFTDFAHNPSLKGLSGAPSSVLSISVTADGEWVKGKYPLAYASGLSSSDLGMFAFDGKLSKKLRGTLSIEDGVLYLTVASRRGVMFTVH